MARQMKDSGVEWIGQIPEDWEIVRIKQLFAEVDERCTKGNEYTLLSVSEYYGVSPKKDHLNEDDMLTHAETLDGYKICRKNDIVMNIMLAWKRALGVSEYVGIISPAYCVYRARQEVCAKYFHYLFRTDIYAELFKQNSTGIIDSRLRLYPDKFLALKCQVPPLEQQEKIVSYLDRKCAEIDAIIAKQQQIIEKLKEYKLSVITEAVTKGFDPNVPMKDSGVEWIGKIPEHWAIHKFCWDYSAMLGKMLDAKRITGDSLHPYIKNADVQWDFINFENLDEMDFSDEEKERYSICPGDLMVCEGGEIGKCAVVPNDAPNGIYYQKALHRVRRQRQNSGSIDFLSKVLYCMAKNNCLNTSPEKATIAHLPGDALSQLRIPAPPFREQNQIAGYLKKKCAKIDEMAVRKQAVVEKLQKYKKSLIYEVVTGKREVS